MLEPAVLKLGVVNLFRVTKYILWVAKVFLSRHFTSYSLKIVAFKDRGNLKIFRKGS
jgi:hypothetical protein